MKILSRAIFLTSFFCLLSAGSVSAAEKIDINTSPPEDLMKIIHIGEARALELISLRPFSSLDDLIKIKGIGEKRLADIKKQGWAWVGPLNVEVADVGGRTSNMLEVGPRTSEPQTSEIREPEPQSSEFFEAAVNAPAQKSPFFLPIAGLVAIFSGVIILILKKGLK